MNLHHDVIAPVMLGVTGILFFAVIGRLRQPDAVPSKQRSTSLTQHVPSPSGGGLGRGELYCL